MCVILFSYKASPRYPLILAANRDEFFNRPASPAEFWEKHPHLLAGKDLKQGGTWLGVARNGHLAALTNYRDLRFPSNLQAVSRGNLVLDYLIKTPPALPYLRKINETSAQYNHFNIFLGKFDDLLYYSSVGKSIQRVKPGTRGLSNNILDTPWPKVKRGKLKLRAILEEEQKLDPEKLLSMLKDSNQAPDEELPDTGIGLELERMLSPIFIKSLGYGTRVSTVLIINNQYSAEFVEATFNPQGKEMFRKEYSFKIH